MYPENEIFREGLDTLAEHYRTKYSVRVSTRLPSTTKKY